MYTLKISDDNTVTTTVKETLIERSNYVDRIQIVTNKLYREQIDMSDTTVYMKYKLPVSNKIKMTQLTVNNLEYETNYIQYLIPVDAGLTAEAGDIEVSFTFLKLVANDDGTYTSYIRKTTSGVIHITPLTQFDKYEPSEMFTEIDQRLLAIEGYIKDLDALNKATYENAVKDIRLDTEKRKVTLTNNDGEDTGKGIAMTDLSKMVSEDLTGKDPDGVQDGVVHLDQVIDLDKLLM
ncbi:MAG: hypothetical protein [Bacteriophage sp.]|jgi:hypothetical protein|nr:MAG: hypothetical protein [Bacteriophage sp.]